MTGATMRRIAFYLAVIVFAAPIGTFAQEDAKPTEPPTHYYRLAYSIQEVGDTGKVINSRAYTTSISNNGGPPAQIRTGDKVPVLTDSKEGNVQYIDVGVSIDCTRAQEVDGKLSVQMTADISNTTKSTNESALPLIRANRWSANVLVPVGKPTIIFSSDNLQDKGKLQVELTATRID
jgi:hypothetical protein